MDALPLASGGCGIHGRTSPSLVAGSAVTLREWHRVLEVGGLLMFTTYGPDTLKELRAAFAASDAASHVHPFVDMHDLSDALVAARFADSVMDIDLLTVTYARPEDLFRDLRATGQRNAHERRRRALGGRRRWDRMRAAYAAVPRRSRAGDVRDRLRPRVEGGSAQARGRPRDNPR